MKKLLLVITALLVLVLGSLSCAPLAAPAETPTPAPTPKSTYELALEKLDYQTAQHWKGVERNYNSEQAINELAFIPEEGRLVLAKDIENYAADGNIIPEELSDLADPDRDGIINSKDAYLMDPSNKQEISQKNI